MLPPLALVEPAAEEGVRYTDGALDQILAHSGRYPYFLQQYGKHAWLTGSDNLVDERAVERAHQLVLSVLDTDFFHVRFERATPAEQRYLAAMSAIGTDLSAQETSRGNWATPALPKPGRYATA